MSVKVFRHTDYGAPQLYGNISASLIAVLDACLLSAGFGSLNISSITHAAGVVTVTTELPHGLTTFGRQTIAGVAEAGYNGEFVIAVTDSNKFTYQAAGITIDTGTGTMTTKSAGLGWTKSFSGTNLAAYRQGGGNLHYFRVDDSAILASRVSGYETMAGISAGTGQFPTAAQFSGGLYAQRSSTNDASNAREWILIGNEKTFYLWVSWNSNFPYTDAPIIGFGDFPSTKPGDTFNTFLTANTTTAVAGFRFSYLTTTVPLAFQSGMYLARSFTQIGTSNEANKISDSAKTSNAGNMGSNGMPYPHPPDGALYVAPVWIVEVASTISNNVIRGVMPGVWNPLHNRPLAHGDTFQGSGPLAGKTFLAVNCQTLAQVMFEISDTWD